MTDDDFVKQFTYLVNKYVKDKRVSADLIENAKTLGPSAAKGLMRDFNKYAESVESDDSKVIKDIAFYFI